jgi:hypothetical protein
MSEATQSSTAPQNQGTGSTVASGGSAGSNTPVAASGAIPSSTPVVAPKGFRQDLQQMLQGWQTAIPSGSAIQSSNGSALTQAAVLEQLQGYLGVYTDLDAAATALQQVRAQEKSQLPGARQYLDVLRAAVANFFGAGNPQLVQFGFQPKKARKAMSSSTLAVRAAKAKATRKLRGTMGKQQKAPIKAGTVQYAVSVQEATPDSASAGTAAASTAPSPPTVGAAGSPTVGNDAGK